MMKKIFCFLFTLSLAIFRPGWGLHAVFADEGGSYPIIRYLRYSFTLQNKSNRLLENVEFWAYAPVKRTSSQICLEVESSPPGRLVSGKRRNQYLKFTIDRFPPFATKIITVKSRLGFSPAPLSFALEEEDYLGPEEYIEVGHPEIFRAAGRFKAKDRVSLGEEIFRWVSSWIKHLGYLGDERGALYALRKKEGDCTEYMALFVALCRTKGIPARGMAGYLYEGHSVMSPADYHNWAEFYEGGRWWVADPQKKIFKKRRENFISLRVTGDEEAPLPGSVRFKCAAEAVKVSMGELYLSVPGITQER